jgi:IS4 transposase
MAIKCNRKVALSKQEKQEKKYRGISSLKAEQQSVEVWVEEIDFPLLLTKQVFKNEDGTEGVLYLVCSELSLSYEQIATIYKRRWNVEVYHKSVKNNAGFSKSPTKTTQTQINHFILSILAYVKLKWLKLRNHLNHFALKSKIYISALEIAMKQLNELSTPISKRYSCA